jgi:hypothetical protein
MLSFNCKNIKTIGPFLHHHHNKIDILLLQEHWLFDHELSLLNEVSQKYCGTGKAVNTMDDTFFCCPRVEKLHVREEDLFDIGC